MFFFYLQGHNLTLKLFLCCEALPFHVNAAPYVNFCICFNFHLYTGLSLSSLMSCNVNIFDSIRPVYTVHGQDKHISIILYGYYEFWWISQQIS